MQALIDSHKFMYQLTTKGLLRTAYMWRFSKDISDNALEEDSETYDAKGKEPPYVVDYLIHCYGPL